MQPTSLAAMSGGLAVKAGKRRDGAGRSRTTDGDYTARRFPPVGLALTAWGPQVPSWNENAGYRPANSREGSSPVWAET